MILREGIWHLRMRVPKKFALIESRSEIHRSLNTGDLDDAEARKSIVKQKILAELNAGLSSHSPHANNHYEAIAELTATRSFAYRTAQELAEGDSATIMDRVLSLLENKDAPTSTAATALLGGIERPTLTITEVAVSMPNWFSENIKGKAARAQKTWCPQWTRPASKVVELLGRDPVFTEIERQDAVALRDALKDRILEDDLLGKSAQKELRLLNTLWEKFHEHAGIDEREMPRSPFYNLGKGFAKMDEEEGRKPEVPVDIIRDLIVPTGALDFMNDELRDIILILVETGARQSEITDLPPRSIYLNDTIPHISIEKETGEWAREIKNKPSKRKIPLVGAALAAFQRHPEGFPRYRFKGTFSAAANKALHVHKILPENITIGGLRHSLETRLINAGFPNDERAALMGHSVKKARGREVYGDGMSLEERLSAHNKIMFKSPTA